MQLGVVLGAKQMTLISFQNLFKSSSIALEWKK
jgi:hypothetical protein